MDAQELEAKRQEALSAGYSEEDIQQYLQTLAQPGQQPQPQQSQQGLGNMNRSEENTGLLQGIGGKALEYGAELYAGKKLLVDPLMKAIGGRGPVAPPTTEPLLNQTWDKALGVGEKPSMLQQGMQYANKVKELAMEKLLQGPGLAVKGGVGAMAALTPANQNQNYPVPKSGPYRGMEINPMTHRPWTQQELMQINR